MPLQTARKDAFPRIREILEKQYDALCSGSEKAGIDYRPDLPEMSIDETLARLESGRERDRMLGVTRRGPHRDDFVLNLNQLDAKTYASEGQQRGTCTGPPSGRVFLSSSITGQNSSTLGG